MSGDSIEGSWYVVRTMHNFERKVKESIEDALVGKGYKDDLFEVDLYQKDVEDVRRGKKVVVRKSVLPGYILVRMRWNQDLVNLIMTRRGVIEFMSTPVKSSEVENMRSTMVDSVYLDNDLSFVVGESVRICDGAFKGLAGVVDAIEEKKQRVRVAIFILGRTIPIELDYKSVEKN